MTDTMAPVPDKRMSRAERRLAGLTEQIAALTDQVAELNSEISTLTRQRDRTRELHDLEDQVEKIKLERDRLKEQHAREIRETEHQTGLLRRQVDQDQANAKVKAELAAQEAKLEVREENLQADKDRFAAEVAFQRQFMEREVGRLEGLIKEVLARVPKIEVKAGGQASARSRREEDDDE